MAQRVKHLPARQETWVQSLDWEDPLEKEMATPSSILAWIIPWTEEPGRLQSMGLQSRTQLSYFTSITVQCSPSSKGYCGHSISQKKMRHVFFKFWGSNLSQLFLPPIHFKGVVLELLAPICKGEKSGIHSHGFFPPEASFPVLDRSVDKTLQRSFPSLVRLSLSLTDTGTLFIPPGSTTKAGCRFTRSRPDGILD